MAIFASYDSNQANLEGLSLEQLSFSSLGQATAVCSKCPNLPMQKGVKFNFACSNNYFVSSVFASGLLHYDPSSITPTTLSDIKGTCYETDDSHVENKFE